MESRAKCSAGSKSPEKEAGPDSVSLACPRQRLEELGRVSDERKRPPRKKRPRGLNCDLVEFYCVMVAFTVIAVLVTPPEASSARNPAPTSADKSVQSDLFRRGPAYAA